jgi:hypothetical protein
MLFEYHAYMETKLAKRNSLGVSVHGDFDAGTGREAAEWAARFLLQAGM